MIHDPGRRRTRFSHPDGHPVAGKIHAGAGALKNLPKLAAILGHIAPNYRRGGSGTIIRKGADRAASI